jgi:hypothetical protein
MDRPRVNPASCSRLNIGSEERRRSKHLEYSRFAFYSPCEFAPEWLQQSNQDASNSIHSTTSGRKVDMEKGYGPARRASRISPMNALRQE